MRNRGFAGAEVLIWLVVIAAVLGGLYYIASALDERGHDRGVAERDAFYTKRDNEALAQSNQRIKALEEEARAQESMQAAALVAISTDYERKLANANRRKDADVAAARSGDIVLRDPYATTPVCPGGAASQTPAAAGQRDGPAPGELSRQVTADLYALVDDADLVTEQLASCQAVILKDRGG